MKKKRTEQIPKMGYCPFESRYNGLYRDTGLGRCGLGTAWGPRHGQDSPTIRPSLRHMRHGRPARKGKRRAREVLAAEGLCRDTNGRIVIGTRLGCWVVSRYRRDTSGGRATIRRKKLRYEQHRVRGARRYNARHGQPGLRHGWCWACDTALCVLPRCSARGLCVQSGFKVCTWCTQPSFGLSALFQSLFGPLFMDTVHKIFQKKNQLKSNQIKSFKIKFLMLIMI